MTSDLQTKGEGTRFTATLASNLLFLRDELGLTLAETAEYTGLSNTALSGIENQKTKDPGFSVIKKLSFLFGVSPVELTEVDLSQTSSVVRAAQRAQYFEDGEGVLAGIAALNNTFLRQAKGGYFRSIGVDS